MIPLLIGGERITTAEATENINPSDTSDSVGAYALAGRAETQTAIAAARDAFPAWSQSDPQMRADILLTAGSELRARAGELGELLSREEGKPRADGIAEATRAANILLFFAGEALRQSGEILPSVRPGVRVEMTREPLGVVGLITPWNFPLAIPAWKIAPALAHGNTVVFKPAELVPGSAWALVDILLRAGLPPGVLNLVTGRGTVAGQAMLDAPELAAISFTGSAAVGAQVAAASVPLGRRYQLEMGGKNPLVVLDDADLEIAVQAALDGAFFATGQRCTASSRLIVTQGIHARFVEALATAMQGLRTDHALKDGTQIGPVASSAQLEKCLDYLAIGRAEGGNLRTGGEVLRRDTPGHYLSPALLTDTTNAMRINREEVFGPVATVIRARDYEEALALANDTPMGLTAGICTTRLANAEHFKRHAQAGMVMVNLPTAGVDYHVSFGGRKGSSFGPREQGHAAREFYTQAKTAYSRAGVP